MPKSALLKRGHSGLELATLVVGLANTIWSLGVAISKHVVKMNAAKSEGAGQVNRGFKA